MPGDPHQSEAEGRRCENRVHRAGQPLGEWIRGELQRQASRRTARRRDLLHVEGGPDRDRELAAPLQRRAPSCFSGLQAAGTRGVSACPCSVAVCAHSNGSDGHDPAGADGAAKLTLQLDHSMGAGQLLAARKVNIRPRCLRVWPRRRAIEVTTAAIPLSRSESWMKLTQELRELIRDYQLLDRQALHRMQVLGGLRGSINLLQELLS